MTGPPPPPGSDPEARPLRRLRLRGEQETLVIPLYARALDYRSKHSILKDRKSSELVDQIDFDFEKLRSAGGPLLAVRARQLDEWTRGFIGRTPNGVVLNLGCGLDTRISRVAPPPTLRWYDVDFPGVIELRRNFFSDGGGYRMLGASVTDPGWLDSVPNDQPVMAVADGVLEYLGEEEVRTLFHRLTKRFSHGRLAFDVMNSWALATGNAHLQGRSEARLRWAVDDLRTVDALDPRLRRTAAVPMLPSRYLPLGKRVLFAVAYLVPRLRTTVRLLCYEF